MSKMTYNELADKLRQYYRNTRSGKTIQLMILRAVEKRVPEKPIEYKVDVDKLRVGNGFFCRGTTVYRCPHCMIFISRVHEYCYECGQAIDWSDEK